MKQWVLFVTGTDTGVGKTVLAGLLIRQLRRAGVSVAAFKPLGSGGRGDAQALRAALGGTMSLGAINPWHFRAPLAPLVAARREGQRVRLADVLARRPREAVVLIVEGAGGLLSPLGEDFDARELIVAWRATPVVVCPNRLGAVNQARLVLAALPAGAARRAQVVLVEPRRPDAASRSNPALLAELVGRSRVHRLPWLTPRELRNGGGREARRSVVRLLAALGISLAAR